MTAPLGMNKRRSIGRLPLGLIGVAIMTVIFTTGFIWIGIVDDPNGGEPMATIELSSALDGVAPSDIEIVDLPDGSQLDLIEAEQFDANGVGPDGSYRPSRQLGSALKDQPVGRHLSSIWHVVLIMRGWMAVSPASLCLPNQLSSFLSRISSDLFQRSPLKGCVRWMLMRGGLIRRR